MRDCGICTVMVYGVSELDGACVGIMGNVAKVTL
jgi:hypothetical protein